MKALDVTGQRYGRLIGVQRLPNRGHHTYWLFRCDCGRDVETTLDAVRRAKTLSCGCWSRELISSANSTHGHTKGGKVTRAFAVWRAMKARCQNPNTKSYHDYGGRGVKVCDRWQRFECFLDDMGEPAADQEIDRIDVNGDYDPLNCRWVSKRENVLNRRNTVFVDLDGERVPLSVAAERLGVRYASLRLRISKGQTAREASLTLPKVRPMSNGVVG